MQWHDLRRTMIRTAGPLTALLLALFSALLPALPAAAQGQQVQQQQRQFEFTQDYDPSPAIWELSDEDTTIYLLGTIHALPRGFRWRSERLNEIIDTADVLVVESSTYAEVPDAIDLDSKLVARIANRLPTSNRLSNAGNTRWRELVGMSGLDFASIDTMPVLLGLLTVGMSGGEFDTSSTLYGVETVLEREFMRSGRPIRTIEDSGEVMYSLLRLDNSEILRELDTSLTAWDGKSLSEFFDEDYAERYGDAYWEAEHNWARGIVADDFELGLGSGAIGRAFDYNLLDRRNAAWAIWLEERLEQPGTVLLAVGAGHFEGESSLLNMLMARGLEADRIE
ncbi:TraB/GumN family protein [Aurantiacibacter marinus]|nr:TraB/GumN family protein [Aurantiacibacter marinus]